MKLQGRRQSNNVERAKEPPPPPMSVRVSNSTPGKNPGMMTAWDKRNKARMGENPFTKAISQAIDEQASQAQGSKFGAMFPKRTPTGKRARNPDRTRWNEN